MPVTLERSAGLDVLGGFLGRPRWRCRNSTKRSMSSPIASACSRISPGREFVLMGEQPIVQLPETPLVGRRFGGLRPSGRAGGHR